MITVTRYTHFTRPLTAREQRVMVLYCQSHGYKYSCRKLTDMMIIDGLSITQAKALARLEDAVTKLLTYAPPLDEELTNA